MIWVDNDACPRIIKEIILRGCLRTKAPLNFVANSYQKLPANSLIQQIVVSKGFDAADHYIIKNCSANDLVITADVPLAYELVHHKKVLCINPRGYLYNESNVGDALSSRNLLTELRNAGLVQSRQAGLGEKEKRQFAALFDQYLAKNFT